MRKQALVLLATVGIVGSALGATAHALEADTFYLRNDGIPSASLSGRPPKAGELSNFDPGRDISPGLLLQRTPNGLQETDEAKYQHWQTDIGHMSLSGIPTLVLWASVKDFDTTKVGVFTAYLLQCPEWGYDCTALAAEEQAFQLSPTDIWVETMVTFPEIDYEISDNTALAIRIVASDESEDDLLIAYDRINYRSRLVFTSQPLVAAVTGEVQDAVPVTPEEPAAVNTVVARPESLTIVDEEPEPSLGSQSMDSVLEWLVAVGISAAMLGTLALVLLESLSRGGNHTRRSHAGPGRYRLARARQRTSISIHPTDDSPPRVVTRRN